MKNISPKQTQSWERTLLSLAVASCFTTKAAVAAGPVLPAGPTVINGQVYFNYNGNLLQITNTPGAIINWQGFSIGASEITRFIQQSASSAVLNRVAAGNPSLILGALQSQLANGATGGRVFLINPSGVVFGAGAQINTGGLVVSTLGLSDADFKAGRNRFTEVQGAGDIVNQGKITTPTGGSIYLIAPSVTNSGIIQSDGGEIILAAGRSVDIVNSNSPDLRVTVTAPDNQAVNLGQIIAQGGSVGIYGGLVRQGGVVNANTAIRGENGKIVFKATKDVTLEAGSRTTASGPTAGSISIQSDTGKAVVAGAVEANATQGKGGAITVAGAQAVSVEPTGSIAANGVDGGTVALTSSAGSVAVAGTVTANATTGRAGQVALTAATNASLASTALVTASGGQGNGSVSIKGAGTVTLDAGSKVIASGATGGTVSVQSEQGTVVAQGTIDATGVKGTGGNVQITAVSDITLDDASQILVGGLTGGVVKVQSSEGTLLASGLIDGQGGDGPGGLVWLLAPRVGLVRESVVNVSGRTGGGTVLVGGDYHGDNLEVQNAWRTYVGGNASITADALESGNGGKIVVWADDTTRYYGSISARGAGAFGNGGFSEVSGKNVLDFNGTVNLNSPYGVAGTLLLDPRDLTISTGSQNNITGTGIEADPFISSGAGSILNVTTLQTQLGLSAVRIQTGATGGGNGDITILNNVTAPANSNNLTLEAHRNIDLQANIDFTSSSGTLVLKADGVSSNGVGAVLQNGGILQMGPSSQLQMSAGSGIGSLGSPILTTGLTNVAATTGTGGIFISNSGSGNVNVTSITTATGGTTTGLSTTTTGAGDIKVVNTAGSITVSQPISTIADTSTGNITLQTTAGTGNIVINSSVSSGVASDVDAAGNQTPTSGSITLTSGGNITGSGQLVTGSANLTAADAVGTDSVTSGSVTLNATAGSIGLSNANAIQIGAATRATAGVDTANAGSIVLFSSGEINNGTVSTPLGFTIGLASNAGTNNQGTLQATTTGGAVGKLFVTSASPFSIGAITTSGGNVSIATTGAGALLTATANIDTTNSGGTPAGASITLTADDMDLSALAANSIKAGTGANTVILKPNAANRSINITNGVVGGLDLSLAELKTVSVAGGTLQLGSTGATGDINLNATIATTDVNAGTFRLLSGHDVNITGGNDIGTSGTPFNHHVELKANNNVSVTNGNVYVADNKNLTIVADNDSSGAGQVNVGGDILSVGTTGGNTGFMSLQGQDINVQLSGGGSGQLTVTGSGAQTFTSKNQITFDNTTGGTLAVSTSSGLQSFDTSAATGSGNVVIQGSPSGAGTGSVSISTGSGGTQNFNLKGGLTVQSLAGSNSTATAGVSADAGQTIVAKYVEVIGQGSALATISNDTATGNASNEVITVSGTNGSGESIVVKALGTAGAIIQNGIGVSTGRQNITINGAGANLLRVIGTASDAKILANGTGVANNQQNITVNTGTSNKIEIGDVTGGVTTGISGIIGRNQTVIADALSIRGGSGITKHSELVNNSGAQTVTLAGTLTLVGGTAVGTVTGCGPATGGSCAFVSNNGTGLQHITANKIDMKGGDIGGVTGAYNSGGIFVNAGDMQLDVGAGGLVMLGGDGSATGNNGATIGGSGASTHILTLAVSGDTTLTGGTTDSSSSFIGLGGVGSGGSVTVTFTGTTGDVNLNGSSGLNAGAAIGAGRQQDNATTNVAITGKNITLNPGTVGVARIGHSTADVTPGGGNISVTATGGDIKLLNGGGAAGYIRTTGNVTLQASSAGKLISEQSGGHVDANLLTVTADSGITLAGNNVVSSFAASNNTANAISLTNTVALDIAAGNITNTGRNVTLNNSAAVTDTGSISAGGLELLGSGPYTLDNAANSVTNLAANITGAGNALTYINAGALTVGTVNTSGVATNGGAVTLAAGGTGTLDVNQPILTTPVAAGVAGGSVILEAGGAITLATSGTINTSGVANTAGVGGAGGEIFIHHTNAAAGDITLGKTVTAAGGSAAGGGTTGGNGAVVTIVNDDGKILLNAALDASGGVTGSVAAGNGGTIQLKTAKVASAAQTITQSAAITAAGASGGLLKITSSDDVTLQTAGNDVAIVAANVTAAGKFFKYTDSNALAVDQIAAAGTLVAPSTASSSQALMNGITTNGGGITVVATAGALSLNQAVNAAAGAVSLTGVGITNATTVTGQGGIAVDAGTGTFTNNAASTLTTSNSNNLISIIADDWNLVGTSSITTGASGGAITIDRTANAQIGLGTNLATAELATVTTSGNFTIGSAGNSGGVAIAADVVFAGTTPKVKLLSGAGAVTDAGGAFAVTATNLDITAKTGVGSVGNGIKTTVSGNLSATNTTSGDIYLAPTAGITLGGGGTVIDEQVSGGTISVVAAGAIDLAGIVQVSGGGASTVTLNATGNLTSSGGGVTAQAVNLTASNGIGNSGTPVPTTSTGTITLNAGAGGAFINNTGSVTLATPTLAANAPITVKSSGTLTLPAFAFSTGTGAIDFESNGGTLATNGALTTTSGSITLVGSTGLTVGHLLTSGSGAINLSTTTSGDVSVSAGGISSTSGPLTVSARDTVDIGAMVNTGSGTVTINANTDGAGAQGFTQSAAAGSITTTNATPGAVAINVNAAGGGSGGAALRDITIGPGGTIAVTTATGGNATGGSITQTAGTLLTSGAGGSVLLNTPTGGASSIGTVGANILTTSNFTTANAGSGGVFITETNGSDFMATATGAGDIKLTASNGLLNIAGITSTGTGNITLISTALNITQVAKLVGNVLTTSSVNGTTLNNPANAVSGFSASNTGSADVSLTNTLPLNIAAAGITQNVGNLNITNTGAITQTGTISNNGGGSIATIAAGAGNNITLGGANDFNQVNVSNGNNVTLNDVNALVLGASTISGTYSATAGGAITTAGTLALNGVTNTITSTGAATDVTISNAITHNNASASTLTFKSKQNVVFATGGSVAASSGTLAVTLNSDSDAAGGGAISMVSGTSIDSNGGSITLGGGATPSAVAAIGNATYVNGVTISGATLTSGAGNISILGQGFAGGAGPSQGVRIANNVGTAASVTSTTGTIGITGTGGNSVSGGQGVMLDGYDQNSAFSSATVSSSTGAITITGNGATNGGDGLILRIGGAVQSTSGDINLNGTSNGPTGIGVNFGGFSGHFGSAQTGGAGNITITGVSNATSGSQNVGVGFFYAGSFAQTAAGNLTITGTGGSSGSSNDGVLVVGARVTTGSGLLSVTGTGGGDAGTNHGVRLDSEAASGLGGTIEATGAGSVVVIGTAGFGGSGINSSNSGGAFTDRIGNATMTGNITLKADTIDIANNVSIITNTVGGTRNVYLLPKTGGTAASIGGAAGFDLTQSELTNISTNVNRIVVGEDATPTVTAGVITTAGGGAVNIGSRNLTLSGTSISAGGNTLMVTGGKDITLKASTGAVDGNVGASVDYAAGTLNINAVTGIGSTNQLSTSTGTLAAANTTSNNVSITNNQSLNLGAGSTVSNSAAAGSLSVAVTGNDNDLTISNTVQTAGGGAINLSAARHILFAQGLGVTGVSTAGTATLTADTAGAGNTTRGAINGQAAAATDVAAGTLNATGNTGIGFGSALETALSNLSFTNSGTGPVLITNTSPGLTIAASSNTNGGITVSNSTGMTTSGLISTGALSNGAISLTANGGTLTLGAGVAADGAGTVGLTAVGATSDVLFNAATTSSGSGNITVTGGRDILLNAGSLTTTGTVNLMSAQQATPGIVNELGAGTITAGALVITSAGGITLANANAVGAFNATNTTSGNIQLVNTAAPLTITNISQSGVGTVNVNNIGAISAGPISTTGGGGTVTLTSTGAETIGGSINAAGGANINLNAGGIINQTVGTINGGLLTTSSVGGTTLNNANTVTNFNATNITSGNIALTNSAAPLTITGISQAGGGNATVNNTGAVNFSGAAAITGGNLSVTATGAVTQGAVALTGNTLTVKTLNNAGAVITLNSATNDFATIDLRARNAADTLNAAGAITYKDATGFDVATIGTTSTVNLTAVAGAITDSGLITGTTLTTSSAGGTVLDFGDTVTGFNATNTTSGDVQLVNTTGTLTVTGISQTGGGNINVNNTGNLTTSGLISTAANGNIDLKATTGVLTIGSAITAGGTGVATLTATGGANNIDFSGANTLTAGSASLTAAGAVTSGTSATDIDTSANNGTITVSAGTSLGTNVNPLEVNPGTGTMNFTATTGGIFVDLSAGNLLFSKLATVSAGGAGQTIQFSTAVGNIQVDNTGGLNANTVNDNFALTSATTIAESGGALINAASLTTTSVGGTLLGSANTIGAFNATNSGSGNIQFTNTAAPLFVTGISQAGGGSVQIDNTGALTSNAAAITTGGGNLILNTSGTITLTQNITAGAGTVTLNPSAGGVSQTGGALTAANLELTGAGAFSLNQNTNHLTGNLAANISGALTYQDNGAVSVGAAGATNNITTNNSSVDLKTGVLLTLAQDINAGVGTVYLTSTGGISETTGKILANVLGMNVTGAGNINANNANHVITTLSAQTANGTITYQDTGAINVGTVAASGNYAGTVGIDSSGGGGKNVDLLSVTNGITLNNDINAGAAGTVYLTSAGAGAGITEAGAAKILAANLGMNVTAAGNIAANNANHVTGAASAQTANGTITYQDSGATSIGAVGASGNYAGTTGFVTGTNNNIDVKTGGLLTLANDVSAGAGTVYVTSGGGVTETAGKILAQNLGINVTGAGNVVANNANHVINTLSLKTVNGTMQYQDTGAINVGTVAASGNYAGTVGIDSSGGGGKNVDLLSVTNGITLNNDINAGAAGTVYLTSAGAGAGITEAGAAKILAANLGMNVTAAGNIAANNANHVTGAASAQTANGTITYQDSGATSIGAVGASGNYAGTTGFVTGTNNNIDVKTGGLLTINNDINAGSGNVYITSAAGITENPVAKIIANTLGMNAAGAMVVNSATNNVTTVGATTAAGGIQYQDANAVTLNNVAASGNFTGTGAVAMSTAGGNIDVKNGAGALTLSNDLNAGAGNVYLTSGANINQTAGKIIANTLGMNAVTGIVVNQSTNDVTTVAGTTAAGGIQYQDANAVTLNNVAASGNFTGTGAVAMSTAGGNIDVKNGAGALTLSNDLNAGAGNVYLTSGANINQTAGKIIANTLGMNAATGIVVNSATNDVTTVGAATAAGGIQYQDVNAVDLHAVGASGNFAGVSGGMQTAGGNIDVKNGAGTLTLSDDVDASGGNVYLTSGANINQTANKIKANVLGMNAATGIVVNSATNDVTTVGATTAAGGIQYQDANAVTLNNVAASGNFTGTGAVAMSTAGGNIDVKNGAGALTLSNDLNAGAGNVYLTSGANINQTAGKIIANTLGMNAATGIVVNQSTNDVTTVGGTTAAGGIRYQDANAVTLNNVAASGNFTGTGAVAMSTAGGNIDVKNGAGALTLSNDLNAGAGNVYLTSGANINQTAGKIIANTLGMNAAGTVVANSATNDVATMGATGVGGIQYQDANAVTLNNVAASGNFTGTGAVAMSTAGGNIDVKNGAGALTLSNDLNAGAGNVYLTSGANINQTAGKIIANTLGMNAAGAIVVNSITNDVTTIAARTTVAGIQYQDANAVTVGNVGASGNFTGAIGLDSSTGGGNVDIKSGGAITLSNDVNAGASNVYLTSGAAITQGASKILANALGMNAAGAIVVNSAINDVATIAAKTTVAGIQYQDANALTVSTVGASGNFTGATGLDSSTANGNIVVQTGGLLTVNQAINTGNAGAATVNLTALGVTNTSTVKAQGGITVAAGTGTITNSGSFTNNATAAPISMIADDMNIAAGTIVAGSGLVTLTTTTLAQPITLGGGLAALGLSQNEINSVSTTGQLTIGSGGHLGTITVDGPAAINNSTAQILLIQNQGAIVVNGQLTANPVGGPVIQFDTPGSITGNPGTGLVTADSFTIIQSGGIGSILAPLQTNVNKLTAANSGSGDLVINNLKSVLLVGQFKNTAAGGELRLSTTNGSIDTGTAIVTANNGRIILNANDTGAGGNIVVGTTGLTSGGSPILLHAADNITTNGAINSGNNYVEIIAGTASGINNGALINPATETVQDNNGLIFLNAPLNAGTGAVVLVSGMTNSTDIIPGITQGPTGAITTSQLTAVTLHGLGGQGGGGGSIILNTAIPPNTSGAISLFACPEKGCPDSGAIPSKPFNTAPFIVNTGSINPVLPLTDPNNRNYADGPLFYTDTGGTNVSGVGTVNDFTFFTPGNVTITGPGLAARNLTLQAQGTIDFTGFAGISNSAINGGNSGGSLNFVAGSFGAGGDILYNALGGGTIGTAAQPFNHTLTFTATNNISLQGGIYMGVGTTFTVTANTAVSMNNNTVNPPASGSGDVVLAGNYDVHTLGDATFSGRNFTICGIGVGVCAPVGGVNQIAIGENLVAGGNVNINMTGNVNVTAGTSTAASAGAALINGNNVNIGPSVQAVTLTAGSDSGLNKAADARIQATNDISATFAGNLVMAGGAAAGTGTSNTALVAGNNLTIGMTGGNVTMTGAANGSSTISGANVTIGSINDLTMTSGNYAGQSADANIQAANNLNVTMSGNLKLDAMTGGSNSSATLSGTNVTIGSAGSRANSILLKGGTGLVTGATPQVLHADAKITATGTLSTYLGSGGLTMLGGSATVMAGASGTAQSTAVAGLKGGSVNLDVSNLGNVVMTAGISNAQTGLSASNTDLSTNAGVSIVSSASFSPVIAGALTLTGGTATAGPSNAHAAAAALIDGGTDLKLKVGTLTLTAGTATATGGSGSCTVGGSGGACTNVSTLLSSKSGKDITITTGDVNFTAGTATASGPAASASAFAGTDSGSVPGTLATLETINALLGRITLSGGMQNISGGATANTDAAILSVGGIKITGHGNGTFPGLTLNGASASGLFQNVLSTGTIIRLDGSVPPVTVVGGVAYCPMVVAACSGGTFGSGFALSGAPPSNLDPLSSALLSSLNVLTSLIKVQSPTLVSGTNKPNYCK